MIVITVQLVLDCAANEILRGQQRAFVPASCLLDYAVGGVAVQVDDDDADTSGYVEGEVFRTI
ncbi:hypothetical protein [Burkholderia cenocepacia]|uniref:hypothetical protein n=1 Tax=Burkholderia cenocepacia TaxID=95486 RepID=UPI002ABE86F9|nr:hypothetical protein [Burkholderia cenocepacia]